MAGLNKAKGRRSSRKAAYYKAQFMRTERNKLKRKQRRERRKVQFAKA